ncbi:hypothetical protein [Massilia agri]|uniref:Uncharacterized protein n=1 Tax=Massilia agri TaxID=1886785 RepID=A0ABT2AMC5_9BURK|nr:hypothetical protein [Massilia agri]MCS0597373.1 hypothetical protein [Massilia agri]
MPMRSTGFNMVRHACAALVLGVIASPASWACRAPPREQVVTPQELIAKASDVSLAKVVRATPLSGATGGGRPSVEYEFEVQQRILGPEEPRFILIGAHGQTRHQPASADHSDEAFWQQGGGRLYNDMDCVLRPDFAVGESYLIFCGKPAVWRGFERIETVRGRPNPEDKWLSYVVEKLGSR